MTEQQIKYAAFVEDDKRNNRGRLVNCCDELKYMLTHPEVSIIVQQHALNDILTYATTFSNYYKQYAGFSRLEDFPIVNKNFLKEHWNEIAVVEYADFSDNRIKYTSGSTGTPFKMVMDRYKHCRWIAGNKVFRDLGGVPSHTKTVYISGTVADKRIPMERMDRDNVYYLDCKYLDDDSLMDLLHYLADNQIETLTGMASVLEKIAKYIKTHNLKPWWGKPIKAIYSVSEPLKQMTRETVSAYFGCPVYVFYANEENGVLACEDDSGNGYLANSVDFFLEVLSMDSDTPAKDGEIGRLVITDYYNKAFPVIRYENGDLVAKKTMPDGRVYITEIQGRMIDSLYTTGGRLVHYFDAISFLEPFMDIKQFQLIQEDYHNFTWVLNTNNHGYEDFILKECKELFGQDSNWKFEYVDEIPKLRSGKTRMTVCKITEKNKQLR